MTDSDERQFLVPHFWEKVRLQTQLNLSYLKVDSADANWIVADMLRRFSHIRPELPVDEDSPVHVRFAMLLTDAITAEQHLFALRMGRVPGELLEDWSPQGVPECGSHAFIRELKRAVTELQDEAMGGRRAN